MANGGKRPGAGRKPGSRSAKTLEKMAVQKAFNERVMRHADHLFHAQLALSVGSVRVFRIDEENDGNGKIKRTHTLVTDVKEIKKVLDEHEGQSGIVDDSYYFITEVMPDNRAIDSMLNRALGKPKETHEHSGLDGDPIEASVIFKRAGTLSK